MMAAHESTDGDRGLNWPRLYDLLLLWLTAGREADFRDHLLDLAGIGASQRVLDVGCGTGTLAIVACRRALPHGSVSGIDASPKMIAAARRKARRAGLDIRFQEASATALPFDSGAFDVVTMVTVMHMIPETARARALSEAARVLRRGGRLLAVDYGGKARDRRGWIAKHHLHAGFDLGEIRPLLSEAQLAEIDGGPLGWLSLQYLRAVKR